MACGPAEPNVDTGLRWTACDPQELGSGQLRVKRVGCTAELPSGSDGRRGDILLQNQHLSVVFRDAPEALSKHRIGGGTLIDVAPSGEQDRLIEAIPLIEGGWMQVEEMDWGQDDQGGWVRVSGTSRGVPGLEPVIEGEPVSLTWRLAPDSRVLSFQGASELYVHPGRGHVLVGSALYRSGQVLLTDAQRVQDLGGAVIFQDLSQLVVGDWDPAQRALYRQPSQGSCPDGAIVQALDAQGEVVAWMPPDWDTMLPDSAVSLRCAAESEIWGPEQPVGTQLLEPGLLGSWIPIWQGPSAFVVQGPLGEQVVGPEESLSFPPGDHSLLLEAGPEWEPIQLDLTIKASVIHFSELNWTRRIEPGDWRQADFFRAPWPSVNSRMEPLDDARLAAALGLSYAVMSAPEQVGRPYTAGWVSDVLRVRAGSVAQGQRGVVWSVGWSRNTQPGFGTADTALLDDPLDLLAMAMSTQSAGRLGLVDVDWVEQAGPAWAWSPAPTAIRVEGPQDLAAIRGLLEQGERLSLVGPVTWLQVPDDVLPSTTQFERALFAGHSVASTGPWLSVDLSGFHQQTGAVVDLDCQGAETMELLTESGSEELPCGPKRVSVQGPWVLLLVSGEDWAIHSPVWL